MVGPASPTLPLLTVVVDVLGAGVSVTRAALQTSLRGVRGAVFSGWMLELVLGRWYTVLRPSAAICTGTDTVDAWRFTCEKKQSQRAIDVCHASMKPLKLQ